ncbi:hypothetical protein CAPTEDRAFT_204248 [Capitella teleta]|uniref:Glycosyltransferase 2-like domain-containing protein n=1 Tax=Capitella teleta TaxID=283909 RepID=R7VGG2_CAPTE|nr:hypothetical protein CAPTEDRAFT_204248 [Capitella teleta]|eukprot:ELU17657.1 hypothetical protein CAPTEDRAFT_204248 [Capitella teleta]
MVTWCACASGKSIAINKKASILLSISPVLELKETMNRSIWFGLLFVTIGVFWRLNNEHIALRIIVLAYDRPNSLEKCLDALDDVIFNGDTIALNIWIDRKEGNGVNTEVLQMADGFQWQHGPKEVNVHNTRVGLYGQWMNTWQNADIVLYVEDDVDLSPWSYQWLKHASLTFMDNDRVAGISLQDEYLIIASGQGRGAALRRPPGPLFGYPIVGPWGFAPKESIWKDFLQWYKEVSVIPGYKPYTDQADLYTKWYQDMELAGRENTMWTMWFIHYCYIKDLVVLYPNIKFNNKGRVNSSLAVHRAEKGLHFGHRTKQSSQPFMVSDWHDVFVDFGGNLTFVRYNGSY